MPEQPYQKPFLMASPETIMPGGQPIFHDQGEVGLLFLHGFTGSPYEGSDFAEHFAAKGYGVWVPLLPGHGTAPQDLDNYQFADWMTAAEQYYTAMKKEYPTVVVCGQSMGGALALHLAAKYPVDGVVTLAAAVFLKDWRLHLLPLARRVIRYQYKSKGPDINCKEAKQKSASYHKYSIKSLIQFMQLIDHVKGELPQITSPALLVHSRRDHTITYENLDYIASNIASDIKHTLSLENSYHVISVDCEKGLIFEKIEWFLGQIPRGELPGRNAHNP